MEEWIESVVIETLTNNEKSFIRDLTSEERAKLKCPFCGSQKFAVETIYESSVFEGTVDLSDEDGYVDLSDDETADRVYVVKCDNCGEELENLLGG